MPLRLPGDLLNVLAGVVNKCPINRVTVVLQYSGSQTGTVSVPARMVAAYRYRADLPPLKAGTTVRYQMNAWDEAGQQGTSRVFVVSAVGRLDVPALQLLGHADALDLADGSPADEAVSQQSVLGWAWFWEGCC